MVHQPASIDWLPQELESVAYRIARADQCTYRIAEMITDWGMAEPLELVEREITKSQTAVIVKSVRPIPPLVSLLFGEAINHLRSSLDNTVWFLTENIHGRLSAKDAIKVEFPIRRDSQSFSKWQKERKKAKLHALSGPGELAQRIQALQPFEDESQAIPSISSFLSDLWGEEPNLRHPLLLLQDYSNEDKHRQLRLGLSRASASTTMEPLLDQDLRFRDISQGDTLGKFPTNTRFTLDTNVTIMIQRPTQARQWVSPVKELNSLRRYVSDVAIPMLLTGAPAHGQLPPDIELGDSGRSFKERTAVATHQDATARFEPVQMQKFAEASVRPPKRLPKDA